MPTKETEAEEAGRSATGRESARLPADSRPGLAAGDTGLQGALLMLLSEWWIAYYHHSYPVTLILTRYAIQLQFARAGRERLIQTQI